MPQAFDERRSRKALIATACALAALPVLAAPTALSAAEPGARLLALCMTGEERLDRSGPQSYRVPDACSVCVPSAHPLPTAEAAAGPAGLAALPPLLRQAGPGGPAAARPRSCPPDLAPTG